MKFKLEEAIKSNWTMSSIPPKPDKRDSEVRTKLVELLQSRFLGFSVNELAKETHLTIKQVNNALITMRRSGYDLVKKYSIERDCFLYRI